MYVNILCYLSKVSFYLILEIVKNTFAITRFEWKWIPDMREIMHSKVSGFHLEV